MKMEPFPWLRDYLVDMNKLYTELILEKIEDEVLGEKRKTLKYYQQMFDSEGRHKILIKADPGMGKTTLGKKVGWDWAKGIFRMFSMVFFVFLKLVKPGEAIENVIMKQNPELEGLGVTSAKLRGILEKFSHRCLLILDGLDEHGLGKNEDVMKIIQNQKYINCAIIVSSRPHITREIQIHFSTVVGVEGFTIQEAERFVSNFLTDEGKIEQIMWFRPSDFTESSIQQCPILLSFPCLLVAEREIDLSDKTVSMGDIYTHMVKCLYKKYTMRKGVVFRTEDFFSVMQSVGKLAFQTLTSGNPLLQRNEVLKLVGEFAFDFGLFAGHEDFRLCIDLKADIYVTYPHRSLEEFFGSFDFIRSLDEGKSVDDILGSDCKEPIFMINPLVFRFCLWFLSTSDFDFCHRDECYNKLTSFAAKQYSAVFNPEELAKQYPVLSMLEKPDRLQCSTKKFFRDTLDKCKHITTLHVKDYLDTNVLEEDHVAVVDQLFGFMNKSFTRLTKIIIGDDIFQTERKK